jgi:aspartate 1-decarboxylase
MLKSKIQRATITGAALEYEGSITIDETLLKKADILPGEQVHVLNLNNGIRFVTYATAAPPGSGTVLLNRAATRLGSTGDEVIVLSYREASDEQPPGLKPKVVLVDHNNRLREG